MRKLINIIIIALLLINHMTTVHAKENNAISYKLNTNGSFYSLFNTYTSLFRSWDNMLINDSTFLERLDWNKTLTQPMKDNFIPKMNDCNCEINELYYFPGALLKNSNYIIAFIVKRCDVPTDHNYPYTERFIVTYSLGGQIIDHAIVSRSGDLWFYNLIGNTSPIQITVEQAVEINEENKSTINCDIVKSKYTIDEKGYIHREILEKRKGIVKWNKDVHKFLIENTHTQ